MERYIEKGIKWTEDDWAEISWHEIFHNFQDYQFDNKLLNNKNQSFEYIEKSNTNQIYLKLVSIELKLILKALKAEEEKIKKKILCEEIITSRKRRYDYLTKNYSKQSVETEMFYEVSEGTARYVDHLMPFYASKLSNVPGIFSFIEWKKKTMEDIYKRATLVSQGDMYWYPLGFAMSLLFDQIDKTWKMKIFKQNKFFTGLSEELCSQKNN